MTFNNSATPKKKHDVLMNELRNAATFHNFAQSEAGEIQGRWAKPTTVNATAPTVEYPRLPDASPWSNDPVPPEPPYGVDINETPIVGEPHEYANEVRPTETSADVGDGTAAAPASGPANHSPGPLAVEPLAVSGGRRLRGSSSPSTTSTLKRRRW